MKTARLAFLALALVGAATASAQDTTSPAAAAPVAPAAAATPAATATPPDAAPAAAGTVPGLAITWDCGTCEHNDKVPGLIEAGYAEAAQKHGMTVSTTDVAEVAITDIRQRPPGVRVMFGIMAGKDRLAVRVRYNGQEYTAGDTSANAVMGLNYLSGSVGKRMFNALTHTDD